LLIGGVGGEGGVGFCEATAVALSGLAVAGAAAPSAPRSCPCTRHSSRRRRTWGGWRKHPRPA